MNKAIAKPHLGPGLLDFLTGLEKNNDKAWFEAHRDVYQSEYVEPALAFIAALAEPLGRLSPSLTAVPKINGSLRRINRDVRFSKDKRPYSSSLHLIFWTGEKPLGSAGVHFVVAHDHFGLGAGHWAFEPAQLEAYRKAVTTLKSADELLAALKAAEKIGCVPDEPQLARVPRGYQAEEPIATMLRRKGMVARTHGQPIPSDLFGPKAVDFTLKKVKAMLPLIAWLERNVYA